MKQKKSTPNKTGLQVRKKKAGKMVVKANKESSKKAAPKTQSQNKHIKSFPVVGIGASAGGLEAISNLLENLAPNLGMAYVFIQHLSPNHESFLQQILQRKTMMPVVTVKNNMELEKDHVYVIPIQHSITVSDGKLKLQRQKKGDSLRTIDEFLTSLAPLYQQNAIGIILSGTGSDGTLGLMTVKAEGGITFAQDASALYMGMPHHAVDSGCVDFAMPPYKIAKELATLVKHPYSVTTQNDFLLKNSSELRKIHYLLEIRKGVDFSYYKQTTIHRRVLRRMALNRLHDLAAYTQLLKENDAEADALYQDLLITVTDFFRDPLLYNALTTKILPSLFKNRKSGDPVRIWIPGCATGEEAVSFAIVLTEFLGEKAASAQIQIFATDLNEKAIDKSRSGIYFKAALQNVSPQRLRRFFVKTDGQYQVIKSIRDMCIFATHDLLRDPPFSRMDIISCQNVLIYLESKPQKKIMQAFHYSLKSTGFLLLGKAETIGTATDLFEQPSKQYKLYTKRLVNLPPQNNFAVKTNPFVKEARAVEPKQAVQPLKEPDLEKETDKLLLSRYVPACVLVNKDLEILRFRGSTSRYIEPTTGKASLHLLKMIREELASDLRMVIHRAKKEERSARKEGIVINDNGSVREISVEVVPIKGNDKDAFYLIIFKDYVHRVVKSKPLTDSKNRVSDKRIAGIETQLREARDSIKVITEDFEATREELQSANEEVLSSNEELQSINEELQTSKEELQATNEELTTINDELQIRNVELKETGNYAKAIVETIHDSLLILSGDLKVKSANGGFYQAFHVTPEETEGMYLYELGNRQWDIPELRRQLKMVQNRNIPFINFKVEQAFPNIGWKSMLLNAHKFSMSEGKDLILLAIQDLTELKQLEKILMENEERFRLLVQNASDILTVFDQDGTIKYESPAVELVLGYTPEERIGRNIHMDPIVHTDDRNIKIGMLKESIAKPGENIYGEFRLRHKDGSYRSIDAIFRNLLEDKKISGIIANYRDITERKSLEHQKDEFMGIASHELKTPVTSIKAYAQILEEQFTKEKDKESAELLGKMNTQVDRLNTLIVDLLDFTRIEGGNLKFREDEYDLNELIEEVTEDLQRTTSQHIIEKNMVDNIRIRGDRYRTGQVITNLLSNAIKYSQKAKKIILSTNLENKHIVVSVQDFGIGIEADKLEKVFDRFFRITHSSLNSYPGLGLGLYIAAEIVKRQGGKIWARSNKNKGATFYFSLPQNGTG